MDVSRGDPIYEQRSIQAGWCYRSSGNFIMNMGAYAEEDEIQMYMG